MVGVKQQNPESLQALRRDYKARYNLSDKPNAYEVADIAQMYGIEFDLDPHILSFDQKTILHDLARLVGYKKGGSSSLSLGSSFYQYLGRKLAKKKNPTHTNMEAFATAAFKYVRTIKNKDKRDYAELYLEYLLGNRNISLDQITKAYRLRLGLMARQAVEMRLREIKKQYSETRGNPNGAINPKQAGAVNPHGFVIVDEHLNIQKRGVSFDALQDIVDKHNSNHKDQWFVVDADDAKDIKRKRLGKGNVTGAANPKGVLYYVGGKEPLIDLRTAKKYKALFERDAPNDTPIKIIRRGGYYYLVYDVNALKRNATASDFRQHQTKKLTNLAKMFQGIANGEKKRVLESDYTPKDKYRLGYLVQLKIKDGGKVIPINFDGESYLAGDLKNNLWIVGKDSRISNVKLPPKGQMKYIGELIQVDYVTAKKHIEGGKTVRFYHKLGEVTKEKPNLFIDDEGFPIIVGGGYDVWDVGIVN